MGEEVYILTKKQLNAIMHSGNKFHGANKYDIPPSIESVTRFEVIDWRTCSTCDDKGVILDPSHATPITCPRHTSGRVFTAYNIKAMPSVQDDGRTLKVFIQDKEDNA
jgi:hypothetical protein